MLLGLRNYIGTHGHTTLKNKKTVKLNECYYVLAPPKSSINNWFGEFLRSSKKDSNQKKDKENV